MPEKKKNPVVPVGPIDWATMDLKNLLQGIKVFLVEDSEDNQEIFVHFLKSAGAEVIIADDGEKAVEGAFKNDPDIILMDIQIPKLDGKRGHQKNPTAWIYQAHYCVNRSCFE